MAACVPDISSVLAAPHRPMCVPTTALRRQAASDVVFRRPRGALAIDAIPAKMFRSTLASVLRLKADGGALDDIAHASAAFGVT